MANPDSIRPGDYEGEPVDDAPAPAQSGARVKELEGNVFCSPGALSPEIDRILGSRIEDLGSVKCKNDDGQKGDEFLDPFCLLVLEDPDIEVYVKRASDLGVPVRFLKEKIKARFKAADYFRLLSQMVDLVLFYEKKQQGHEVFALPIALANPEFHRKAQETAAVGVKNGQWLPALETLSVDLHGKLETLSK